MKKIVSQAALAVCVLGALMTQQPLAAQQTASNTTDTLAFLDTIPSLGSILYNGYRVASATVTIGALVGVAYVGWHIYHNKALAARLQAVYKFFNVGETVTDVEKQVKNVDSKMAGVENSVNDTQKQLQQALAAIGLLKNEVNQRGDAIEKKVDTVQDKIETLDKKIDKLLEQTNQTSFLSNYLTAMQGTSFFGKK